MRGFLVLLAILVLVAGGALFYYHTEHHHIQRPFPAIGVKIVEENGWDGSTDFLPAINGYATTCNYQSGKGGSRWVNASYQLASTSPGHFFVLAHYKIDWNGSFTEVDQALPVLSSYQPSPIALEKLKQPTWSKLDNHLSAFAYLSDSPLYY